MGVVIWLSIVIVEPSISIKKTVRRKGRKVELSLCHLYIAYTKKLHFYIS